MKPLLMGVAALCTFVACSGPKAPLDTALADDTGVTADDSADTGDTGSGTTWIGPDLVISVQPDITWDDESAYLQCNIIFEASDGSDFTVYPLPDIDLATGEIYDVFDLGLIASELGTTTDQLDLVTFCEYVTDSDIETDQLFTQSTERFCGIWFYYDPEFIGLWAEDMYQEDCEEYPGYQAS